MTMPDLDEDQRVRVVLLLAAQAMTPDLRLLPEVRRRIRRRRRANRLTVAGAVLLVLAATASAVAGAGGRDDPGPRLSAADQAMLDRPTRGDLAADRGYLTNVDQAWTSYRLLLPGGGQGARHLVWAGRTPAGPAAIGVQVTSGLRPDAANLVATFFAEGETGRPDVVAAGTLLPHARSIGGAFIGTGHTVLLVLDRGWQVEYTIDGAGGTHPVRFDGGAAVVALAAGTDPGAVLLSRPGQPDGLQPWLGNRPVRAGPPWPGLVAARHAPD